MYKQDILLVHDCDQFTERKGPTKRITKSDNIKKQ